MEIVKFNERVQPKANKIITKSTTLSTTKRGYHRYPQEQLHLKLEFGTTI